VAAITRVSTSINPWPQRARSESPGVMEELGLERRRQLCDLVQENRPVLAYSNCPGSADGAGEGTLFVAEQLGPRSSRGNGAQLTLTKGPLRRADAAWMTWAMRSLPTPLSPRIKTAASVSAMFSTTVGSPASAGFVENRDGLSD